MLSEGGLHLLGSALTSESQGCILCSHIDPKIWCGFPSHVWDLKLETRAWVCSWGSWQHPSSHKILPSFPFLLIGCLSHLEKKNFKTSYTVFKLHILWHKLYTIGSLGLVLVSFEPTLPFFFFRLQNKKYFPFTHLIPIILREILFILKSHYAINQRFARLFKNLRVKKVALCCPRVCFLWVLFEKKATSEAWSGVEWSVGQRKANC